MIDAPAETLTELLARLDATPSGLTAGEAARRRAAAGANETVPTHLGWRLRDIVRGLINPLAVVLLAASVVSAVVGRAADATIIAAMVLLSAGVNFFQTFRSERAVRRLQARVAPTATALRDGRWLEVPRRDLVPGDVVHLSAGDLVPADARLIESKDLYVQQAALTGESLPVEKTPAGDAVHTAGPDSPELVFLGTSIVSGTATAVVFATGSRTGFGDVVARLAERPQETEFERGMRQFGVLITQTVVILVFFIMIVSIALNRDAMDSLLFAVALAVGLTPEFLPMVTTVALAQGAVRMARQKVIVKHLSAIQNLGAVDVLCSDKTGTLTSGHMALDRSLDTLGEPSPRPLFLGHLNSRFETGIKSPLDAAILERPVAGGDAYTKVDEVPFDFERRRLSVVVDSGGQWTLIAKGAPEGLLESSVAYELGGRSLPLDAETRDRCRATYQRLCSEGLRVLAVAHRPLSRGTRASAADERDLVFAGFLAFSDPAEDGVADSLAALRRDGVEVKILTGDNELVSRHICERVGLDCRMVLGGEIDRMTDGALAHVVERANVFARVSPGQKNRILRALQHRGHVVAFLGDGINDAPSLHAADVGISVAGAVDIAKDASDIVLLERRLDVLHTGIVAGRRSFANVLKYLLMGTSSNFGNMFSMAGAAFFLPFLPMLPTQILLNNFLYDLAQVTIPTDNTDPAFTAAPQRWNIKAIRRFMVLIGPLSSIYDFLTFFVLLRLFGFGEAQFQSGWFVESLATQTLVLFVIRTIGRPWRNPPSAALAITTILVAAAGLVIPFTPLGSLLRFRPLPAGYFVFLAAAVSSYLVLVELVKRIGMNRLLDPPRP